MKDDLTKELEQYYTNGRPNSKQQHKSFSGNLFIISSFIVIFILWSIMCVGVYQAQRKNDISIGTNTTQIIDNKRVDCVKYENLDPAKTYTLTVKTVNGDTGEVVTEQSTQFTPMHENGTTEFEYNSSSLPEHIRTEYRITKIEDN